MYVTAFTGARLSPYPEPDESSLNPPTLSSLSILILFSILLKLLPIQ
jgi:hypothetical protein